MLAKLACTGKTKLVANAAWKIGRSWGFSFYRVEKMPSLGKGSVEPNLAKHHVSISEHFLVMFFEREALTKHCMVTKKHGLAVHICHICVIFLGVAYGKELNHPAKLRKPI